MRASLRERIGGGFAVLAVPLLMASGCGFETAQSAPSSHPVAGLYTPGSTLGASDPTDVPMTGGGLGDRCIALGPAVDAGAATASAAGTLHVRYQTQSTQGRYAPRNCTAVWIETAQGQYVATLELGAGLRKPGLVYFQDHACTEKLGPDVMTTATLRDHARPHAVMWSGVDFEGNPVPDGPYKVFIEVTESDKEPGELAAYEFTKGPTAFDMELPVDVEGPLQGVALSWELAAEGSSGGAADGI